MSEFILILALYSGGPALTAVLFPTKEACENAMKAATMELATTTSRIRAVCVPRRIEK